MWRKKDEIAIIDNYLSKAKKPLILAGNGIKVSGLKKLFNEVVHNLGIPVVFSMPAFDLLEYENPLNYGFIGNNGFRYSNYILYESDLIISIGTRLDGKQVGKKQPNLFMEHHYFVLILMQMNCRRKFRIMRFR